MIKKKKKLKFNRFIVKIKKINNFKGEINNFKGKINDFKEK